MPATSFLAKLQKSPRYKMVFKLPIIPILRSYALNEILISVGRMELDGFLKSIPSSNEMLC